MVDVMVGLSPQAKAQGDLEKKLSALNALVELVDGPPAGEQPRVISDPATLGGALKSVTGVVDHGLFLDLADEALIGTDQGVVKLVP